MLDTEKKQTPKEKALAILDMADKNIPLNPDDLENQKQENSEFQKLFESSATKSFKVGDVVKGTITDIQADFVIVDINYKSEGLISKSEFSLRTKENPIKVGEEVQVYIDKVEDDNGAIILSKDKADIKKVWDDIIRAKDNDEIIQGTVVAQVKGGLSVDIGVRAFLPGSQLAARPVKNMKSYVGQTYDFKVIKVNQKRGNIVISRKVLLEKDQADLPKMSDLKEGSIVKGTVKNITEYGAFVDLGECDGLLHITDMSWSRIEHPSSILKLGQTLDLKVLKYNPEKNRISLGLKQLDQSKWDEGISKFEIGSIVEGKVSNLVDYGAFVLLDGGIEGLVYVNELSWSKKSKNTPHTLRAGDKVKVKVIDIQKDSHKLSLSIKQTMANPWDKVAEKYSVGQIIEGPIAFISDFGLFVKVDAEIDGLVHVSDLSWTEIVKLSDKYKVGDIVKTQVLDINSKDEKFSLGIKQLDKNPWDDIEKQYPVGSRHTVEVTRIVDFGIFVRLTLDIEGLVHISEVSSKRVSNLDDIVKAGDKVEAEILNIDKDSKKIGLSMRVVEMGVQASGGSFSADGKNNNSGFMENIFAKILKRSLKEEEESKKASEAISQKASEETVKEAGKEASPDISEEAPKKETKETSKEESKKAAEETPKE